MVPKNTVIQLVIADDHRVLLEGLERMIESHDHINLKGSFVNGLELLEFLKSETADVVLLDINMPHMDGIKCCKEIRKNHPKVKVIALSTYDKGSIIRQMFKAGALGYLLKDTSEDELIKAIEQVNDGQQYVGASVAHKLISDVQGISQRTMMPTLTRREKQILKLIYNEQTTAEIAKSLFISESTVETHRRNLFDKFAVRNVVGLVKSALETGFLE